ncbi:MAG: protein kinase [Thermoanaerobaculia bacterium]|nr:protein kinase [Thermoanaerobaculia bacterium]
MSSSPFLARLLGDSVKAGDLYYQKGRYGEAAEMYAKAGRYDQAARMCQEVGDRDGAVRYYEMGSRFLEAGEVLAADGAHREALPYFEKAKAWDRAARASLDLGNFHRAARYFEKANKNLEAAQAFERSGDFLEAKNALERESKRLEQRYRQSGAPDLKEQLKKVDLRRAQYLERLNDPEGAAELLLVWGERVRAGELLLRAGQPDRAARAFIDGAAPERALAILDETCDMSPEEKARIFKIGHRWQEAAEAFRQAGQFADAAEAYEELAEWRQAAEMWEEAHESQRAADLYFRAEGWRDAARCFSAVGRHDLAAKAYERIPDSAQAASCHLRWGNFLEAGRLFLTAGDKSAASRAFQEIEPDQDGYGDATLLLAPLLIEEGVSQGALHRLTQLSTDLSGSRKLERLYWEGRALEDMGQGFEARGRYEQLAAVRQDHRDVMDRLANLETASMSNSLQAGQHSTPTPGSLGFGRGFSQGAPPLSVVVEPGAVLAARYLLEEEIGRGGMGRVYRAKDLELNEPIAIKTVLSRGEDATGEYERLLREVQICRKITHPNVVRIYDLGRFASGVFITMEYLEWETLDKVIRREGQLDLGRVKSMTNEILSGLVVAHELKVVHQDLKPSNVFVTEGDRIKVLDFGIARMEGIDVELTTAGEVLGSPKYMSPEQIEGETLDGRTDLYSLGVLLYFMLSGREPFRGKTPSLIAVKQLREPPPPILKLRNDLPKPWQEVLDGLLVKDREERFASANEVIAALAELPV